MAELFSERIQVKCAGRRRHPASLVWRGEMHEVARVEAIWHDYGFAISAPKGRDWRSRRHRNYYRLRMTDGACYEVYLDRSGSRREWILHKKIE